MHVRGVGTADTGREGKREMILTSERDGDNDDELSGLELVESEQDRHSQDSLTKFPTVAGGQLPDLDSHRTDDKKTRTTLVKALSLRTRKIRNRDARRN